MKGWRGVLRVVDIVEKPEKPPSRLAVVPIYVFKPDVFSYIRKVAENSVGEVQLTDAVRPHGSRWIEGLCSQARIGERRLDVGTSEKYWRVLVESYEYAKRFLEAGSKTSRV